MSNRKKDDIDTEDDLELAEEPVDVVPPHNHHHHPSSSLPANQPTQFMKLSTAFFYGISSILVIFTNKAVMTNYKFHFFDFLALVQFIVTTTILLLLIAFRKIDTIPVINWHIFREIFPVSLMFLGNVLCGLGSTKSLNIPMFTALRRFSILMTMVGEWYLLGTKPSSSVVGSILLMVLGAIIAALYDLAFDFNGYTFIFFNNIFTALNGVYMKKAAVSGKVSKMGVLFYNSLFSAIILSLYFLLEHWYYYPDMLSIPSTMAWTSSFSSSSPASGGAGSGVIDISHHPESGQLVISHAIIDQHRATHPNLLGPAAAPLSTFEKVFEFEYWSDPVFLSMFLLAASMGSILNYSIFLCTTTNSALTTAVVGALKNIITTYIGMLVFSDYTFTWINFFGINLSVVGSLYYTYMILFKGAVGFGSG